MTNYWYSEQRHDKKKTGIMSVKLAILKSASASVSVDKKSKDAWEILTYLKN